MDASEHAEAGPCSRRASRRSAPRRSTSTDKNIEKDPALERRFQPVLVARADRGARRSRSSAACSDRYEALSPSPDHRRGDRRARPSSPIATSRDRFLPDKAIDLIDQASARVRLRGQDDSGRTRKELQEDDRAAGARTRTRRSRAEDYERASRAQAPSSTRCRRGETGRSTLVSGPPEVTRGRHRRRSCRARPASPYRSSRRGGTRAPA